MNDQMGAAAAPIFNGAPAWLTLPFALIAAGVIFALLVLWWGMRLAARRRGARAEIEDYNEELPGARPITPPPAAPPAPVSPPLAEPPLAAPPAPEPVVEAPDEPVAEAPEPAVEPEPVAEAPAPEPEPAPAPGPQVEASEPVVDETPAPEPLADEPIAAAAPLDASPASLASDLAEPVHPEPVAAEPEPAPPPPSAAPATDELTRMKGVGPRLAERLASVGITRFAQLAALTPEEADALDARLGDFQGRIHRDRWIEQAGFLANDDVAGFEATFGRL